MSENGEAVSKDNKTGKSISSLLMIIVSCLSAMLLWFYVLGYDSPNYEKDFIVNVSLTGESTLREKTGLTVLSDFGFTIKVTVSGPQSEVNKLRDSDLSAYVDVSDVTTTGNNSLPVNVTLPNQNQLVVSEKSSDNAIVYIDRSVVAEIPVKIGVTDYKLSYGYSVGDFSTLPLTVTVQGPEAEVAKISYAYGEVRPGEIKGNGVYNTSVELFDSGNNRINNSYIQLIDTSVNVRIPLYKLADIPVKVYFVGGYYSTESAKITLSHNYITVKGLAEDVDKISEIRINIAENTLTSDTVVKRITLPDGVESVDGVTAVTAKVEFFDVVKRIISASGAACRLLNVPEDTEVSVLTVNLNINAMGQYDLLLDLTQNSFDFTADLSLMELEKGKTYQIPLNVVLKDEIAQVKSGVFVSGEYSVSIEVH